MKIIFVYNAKSGLKNAVVDSLHKLASPSTYSCNLCELTFSAFSERQQWLEFRENSDFEMVFLHIDEFERLYTLPKVQYPTAFLQNEDSFTQIVSASEFESMKCLDELIEKIQSLKTFISTI